MKKAVEPTKKKPPPKQHQDFDNVSRFMQVRAQASPKNYQANFRKTPCKNAK